MVNRPKNIGTVAETAIVRAARTRGFPGADRLTQTGRYDRGDIGLCPGIIIEAKGGAAAKTASDGLINAWLEETRTEMNNAGAEVAFLVTARPGVGPANAHRWWAWWRLGDLADLFDAGVEEVETPVRMLYADALQLLRRRGYGDPVTSTHPTITKDAS